MGGESLVIGYGSVLQGDDAVGIHAAAAVAGWRLASVRVLTSHQLTPELAAPLSRARRAVFVDAALLPPGAPVAVRRLAAAGTPRAGGGAGHTGDPAELLTLTRTAFGRRPAAWWVLIPAERFDWGAPLSARTRGGLRVALRAIRRLLAAPAGRPARGRRARPWRGATRCPTR